MKRLGTAFSQKVVMALVALVALVAVPAMSLVGSAQAGEAPCPHMAEMSMTGHGDHAMPMAGMPAGSMDDMDCCDDAKAMSHDSSMSGCSVTCKASCLQMVTALLSDDGAAVLPLRYQPVNAAPPIQLIAQAVGFTTPPPRI